MGKCKKGGADHAIPARSTPFLPPTGTGTGWRGLLLAVLVLAVLFLLYGCAVQRLIYSSRGTMIFLPERPLL